MKQVVREVRIMKVRDLDREGAGSAIRIMAAIRRTDRQECLSYRSKSAILDRLSGHRMAKMRIAGAGLTSPPALPTNGRERAGRFCG